MNEIQPVFSTVNRWHRKTNQRPHCNTLTLISLKQVPHDVYHLIVFSYIMSLSLIDMMLTMILLNFPSKVHTCILILEPTAHGHTCIKRSKRQTSQNTINITECGSVCQPAFPVEQASAVVRLLQLCSNPRIGGFLCITERNHDLVSLKLFSSVPDADRACHLCQGDQL